MTGRSRARGLCAGGTPVWLQGPSWPGRSTRLRRSARVPGKSHRPTGKAIPSRVPFPCPLSLCPPPLPDHDHFLTPFLTPFDDFGTQPIAGTPARQGAFVVRPEPVESRVRLGGSSLRLLTTNQLYGGLPPCALRS